MFSRPAAFFFIIHLHLALLLQRVQQVDLVFERTPIFVRPAYKVLFPFDSRTRFMREINELANDVLYMRA